MRPADAAGARHDRRTIRKPHREADQAFARGRRRGGSKKSGTSSSRPDRRTTSGGAADPRYKTELCNKFRELGRCPYGDRCRFAHGVHELRRSERAADPRYKTQRCKHFWETGKCPYAKRCRFIHRETKEQLRQLREVGYVCTPVDAPTPGVSPSLSPAAMRSPTSVDTVASIASGDSIPPYQLPGPALAVNGGASQPAVLMRSPSMDEMVSQIMKAPWRDASGDIDACNAAPGAVATTVAPTLLSKAPAFGAAPMGSTSQRQHLLATAAPAYAPFGPRTGFRLPIFEALCNPQSRARFPK